MSGVGWKISAAGLLREIDLRAEILESLKETLAKESLSTLGRSQEIKGQAIFENLPHLLDRLLNCIKKKVVCAVHYQHKQETNPIVLHVNFC